MNTLDPNNEILIVTDTALAAGPLAGVVRERVNAGSYQFTLLVPAVAHGLHRVVDPEDRCCAEAEETIRGLRPALEAAAGGALAITIGTHEPMAAIQDALNAHQFGEVILATRSHRLARWARLDLASKVKDLGLPVTAVDIASEPLEAA